MNALIFMFFVPIAMAVAVLYVVFAERLGTTLRNATFGFPPVRR